MAETGKLSPRFLRTHSSTVVAQRPLSAVKEVVERPRREAVSASVCVSESQLGSEAIKARVTVSCFLFTHLPPLSSTSSSCRVCGRS